MRHAHVRELLQDVGGGLEAGGHVGKCALLVDRGNRDPSKPAKSDSDFCQESDAVITAYAKR
jgi:hypothetical protein